MADHAPSCSDTHVRRHPSVSIPGNHRQPGQATARLASPVIVPSDTFTGSSALVFLFFVVHIGSGSHSEYMGWAVMAPGHQAAAVPAAGPDPHLPEPLVRVSEPLGVGRENSQFCCVSVSIVHYGRSR